MNNDSNVHETHHRILYLVQEHIKLSKKLRVFQKYSNIINFSNYLLEHTNYILGENVILPVFDIVCRIIYAIMHRN